MLNQRYPACVTHLEWPVILRCSNKIGHQPCFFSIQKPLQDNFRVNEMDMFHEELELPVQQKVGTLVTSGNHQLVLRKKSTEIQESMRILWLKRGPSIFLQAMRATENTWQHMAHGCLWGMVTYPIVWIHTHNGNLPKFWTSCWIIRRGFTFFGHSYKWTKLIPITSWLYIMIIP